jgi:AraC-like DNA-binding protein
MPSEEYFCIPPALWSLAPRYAGVEQCPSGKRWTGVRDHFLLHYVVSGKGTVRIGGGAASVATGDAFLFHPDQVMDYRAHDVEPWRYMWTGFSGTAAAEIVAEIGVTPDRPVVELIRPNRVHEHLRDLLQSLSAKRPGFPARAAGHLHLVLAELTESRARAAGGPEIRVGTDELVELAETFISENYQKHIHASDVVTYIGLERSYLGRRFRRATGRSIHEYITDTRMKRARDLLGTTSIAITAVAASVGYRSYEVFERAYRRTFGETPRETRRRTGNTISSV